MWADPQQKVGLADQSDFEILIWSDAHRSYLYGGTFFHQIYLVKKFTI
jgi:hypothetical protein